MSSRPLSGPAEGHPTDGRCDRCGEPAPDHPAHEFGPATGAWRSTGQAWGHRCEDLIPQAGYLGSARPFADDAEGHETPDTLPCGHPYARLDHSPPMGPDGEEEEFCGWCADVTLARWRDLPECRGDLCPVCGALSTRAEDQDQGAGPAAVGDKPGDREEGPDGNLGGPPPASPPPARVDADALADEVVLAFDALIKSLETGAVTEVVDLLKKTCDGGWSKRIRALARERDEFEHRCAELRGYLKLAHKQTDELREERDAALRANRLLRSHAERTEEVLADMRTRTPSESETAFVLRVKGAEQSMAHFDELRARAERAEAEVERVRAGALTANQMEGLANWMLKRMDLDNNAHALTYQILRKKAAALRCESEEASDAE